MSSGLWSALVQLQLLLAGFALLLAAQQVAVWRFEGRGSSARLMIVGALATAVVFLTGYAALRSLDQPGLADWLLFVRSAALAGLTIVALLLAAGIAGRRPPRVLIAAVSAIVALRLVLWPTTSLIYRHAVVHGLPSYGPLLGPTGFGVIALVFGYLCSVAGRDSSQRERRMLILGLLGSLTLAALSLTAGEHQANEVLTAYVPLPALFAVSVITVLRQLATLQAVRRLAERERALARLGRFALAADLPAVRAEAATTVAAQTGRPEDDPALDREFRSAVASVVAVAQAQDLAHEKLRTRATIDELTQLPNRAAMRDLINDALDDGAARGTTVAVALCDIDRFRSVNDVHGHPAGDEVLDALARRLEAGAGDGDVVGRFGGDEFVVLCTDVANHEALSAFTSRTTSAFVNPVVTPLVEATVTASVGVVTATPATGGPANADTLLRDADTAMYDAKSRGGAVIGRFDDALRSAVVYRADLERRLSGALCRGEISVHYQPIVSLSDRHVVGVEALARWRQGTGFLPPAQWIPVAESTGLIHDIGEFVLIEAVHQLRRWHEAGNDIGMSVNVSPRQLSSRRLVEAVHGCLAAGLRPQRLTLEVTESLAVDEQAATLLEELFETGVRIAIDDFGTGFSSLGAVSRQPIDVLKIDQSIVRRVRHPDGCAVLTAMVAIAKSLDLRTVAEGVEQPEDETLLADLGCELAQGFLYARPLPADRVDL